jgi:hypothetical protein
MPSLLLFAVLIQSPTDIQNFGAITAFRCNFGERNVRTYHSHDRSAPPQSPESLSDLVFAQIDRTSRRAIVYGGSTRTGGAVAVTVITGKRVISFLATSVDGNPMLTTVFETPRPTQAKVANSYFAVMSQHKAYSEDNSEATQLYGTCRGE